MQPFPEESEQEMPALMYEQVQPVYEVEVVGENQPDGVGQQA
jgi:hypothetical protein